MTITIWEAINRLTKGLDKNNVKFCLSISLYKLENFYHDFSMTMEMNFKIVNFVLSEAGSIQENM